MIHHVQIACPGGSERALRAFYQGILCLDERSKPPSLAARGGCWFTGHGIELHLGVEDDFRPAHKAHPGLLWPADDFEALASRLAEQGYSVAWSDELPGMRRFYSEDPHGNRLEFLTPEAGGDPCHDLAPEA